MCVFLPQKDLDIAANALASTQHENEQTRKKLIDQSDELKKLTPEVRKRGVEMDT